MERIGFVGLGRMGQEMAGRLLDAGFALTVNNRTRHKADRLIGAGAVWADTPAEVVERSDIILTTLTDDRAVEQVFGGGDGLLTRAVEGKLFVEMSTIRTATIHALRPQVECRGGRLLDAPISGGTEPARQGRIMLLVGGAVEDLDRARPVLQVLSRRIAHLGPSGAGTTMKLVLNLPMAIFWAGIAEALALGSQFGLQLDQMLDIYLDSPVALPALRAKVPLLLGEAHEVAFDVTGVRKDLLAMVSTGQQVGVPMPTGSAAFTLFTAATAAGYGERDLAFVIEYVQEIVAKSFGRVDSSQ